MNYSCTIRGFPYVEIMIFVHFYVEFGIITIIDQVPQVEPHYTTSAREFALNVRRHLVL